MYALRGAITADLDTAEAIDEAVKEMIGSLFSLNGLKEEDIVSVLFSQTKDLRSRNAAAACRKAGFCAHVPLFCVQEATIAGGLPLAIRVLLLVNHKKEREARMVYLRGAASLRPEYNKENEDD